MGSSGIGRVTEYQRYRYLQVTGNEPPTDAVLIADGSFAQQGSALSVLVSAPGQKNQGRAHYNQAPLFAAAYPPLSPWDMEDTEDEGWQWPHANSGHRVNAALRADMKIGSVVQSWWFDMRQGLYRVPPCDEFRLTMWVRDWVGQETPIPTLQPITVLASLGAAPQQWSPDPYICTCEAMFQQPSGAAFTFTGGLKALPPYTKRWRSQLAAAAIGDTNDARFAGFFLQSQVTSAMVMGSDRVGQWQEPVDGVVRAAWSLPDTAVEVDVTARIICEVGP